MYFGYHPFVRYIIGKYCLSFCRLLFHVVSGFLRCAEALQCDAVPLVDFCFSGLYVWCHCQEVTAKTNVQKLFPCVFFQQFLWFQVLRLSLLIPFELIFVSNVR